MIPGTRGYNEHAAALVEKYESIPFEDKYRAEIKLLPATPGYVLDVGAGTGADAAWLASRGHRVLAVEPTAPFRQTGATLHPSPLIEWLDDHLPDLMQVRARGARFDAILLTAVWMHLDADERARAMAVVASLLAPEGIVLMAIRRGTVPLGRTMYDVAAGETTTLAARHGLRTIVDVLAESSQAENRAEGITWQRLALRAAR
jgi:SAM-dependent methyltransferase